MGTPVKRLVVSQARDEGGLGKVGSSGDAKYSDSESIWRVEPLEFTEIGYRV